MKRTFILSVFCILLAMSSVIHAEETEIQLVQVVGIGFIPGSDPLDDEGNMGTTPPTPRDFRATIDGTTLVVTKQESVIPSAQAIVANASTGSIVVNQPFTTSITQQIATPGVYALRIHTAGGDLIGQFIVQ